MCNDMKYILPFLLFLSLQIEACTGLRLAAKDGSIVHGRTLEFGIDVPVSIIVVPREYKFTGKTPGGDGLKYTAKFAAVGAMCFDDVAIMDGTNEAGLSVGTFYFPEYAGYAAITPVNQSKSLSPVDFSNWILTQFSNIDDVIDALKTVSIVPTIVKGWGEASPPFHYIVYEKSGRSLTIEPLDGDLIYYDNPLGVLTNSPTFDWHMTNLRNYLNLTPINVDPIHLYGLTLTPFGQGSGMMGLPGDFTPPSRFVRAAIFQVTAIPTANAQTAIYQIFHILNQFDIPVGVAREVGREGVMHTDYTIATVARDPQNLKYYFRTFDDQTIRMVDLNTFDLKATDIKRTSASGRQSYVDVSKELK